MEQQTGAAFLRLIGIMDDLREKCPWDRKQTIASLRQLTIEETYELADAISEENWKDIREELGDLLLHITFYAKIAAEQKKFTLKEVIDGICEKLIARHPHIYADVIVKDEDEVKSNWEKLKLKEGKKSILGGVPKTLPAMSKAMRLQEKVKQVGFEWENEGQVWEKVEEEMKELQQEVNAAVTTEEEKKNRQLKIEDEFGDVIFSLINYARFLNIDAEHALERTNKKFTDRFNGMEQLAFQQGKALADMTLGEMDALWDSIKKQSRAI
jgi:MazG family protein